MLASSYFNTVMLERGLHRTPFFKNGFDQNVKDLKLLVIIYIVCGILKCFLPEPRAGNFSGIRQASSNNDDDDRKDAVADDFNAKHSINNMNHEIKIVDDLALLCKSMSSFFLVFYFFKIAFSSISFNVNLTKDFLGMVYMFFFFFFGISLPLVQSRNHG